MNEEFGGISYRWVDEIEKRQEDGCESFVRRRRHKERNPSPGGFHTRVHTIGEMRSYMCIPHVVRQVPLLTFSCIFCHVLPSDENQKDMNSAPTRDRS